VRLTTEIDCEHGSKIIVEEREEFGHPTRAVLYILSGGSYSEAKLSAKSARELIEALKEEALKETIESEE